MARARKFGTFGGVFTPAILTILGVIMYMRLPWIVGNVGLLATLGIIAAAHVISITTGLSVSSMATDKRVKAGGSYYILSRSLGLPIGGTLGIALFVGLSFSVSLYIIGFSESFLGFWGYEVTTDAIRACGAIVLLLVATVTFISTSLAIKTQYFIMAAIALSLVSVFIGSAAPRPDAIQLQPLAGGASLAVAFGIFFPAVTGFEAGVSMSGDLQDPKRSIPVGTMLAIAVGLVAYLGLAFFLSWRIPQEELANNPQVLLEHAWKKQLVVPGIWAATISSALGSILGAPRILQACAADGIVPRFLEVGHGRENEPRRALMVSFVIALVGILIGELDVIARVVTMFFLTSYGFLNLAAAIESWVSPDFRPDFRIPRLVSLVGAVTSLVLMMQLDLLAMVGATVVMAVLYLLLKRRELSLEGGDTWSGVWTGLVRWGLARLSRETTHERNWRAQVLALGAPGLRRWAELLAGSGGVVSHLDDGDLPAGDVWEARASAAYFHGLPGLLPNTVLLDLDDALGHTAPFTALLGKLQPERHNLVIARAGTPPASPGRIDIWWRGGGGNLALLLALVRSVTSARRWRSRPVRFHIPVEDVSQHRRLEQRLARLLKNARVKATLKPVTMEDVERIAEVSGDAALVLLGLPDTSDPERFRARVASLVDGVGPCLLVRSCTSFIDPMAGEDFFAAPAATPFDPATSGPSDVEDPVLRDVLEEAERGIGRALHGLVDQIDRPCAADVLAIQDRLGRLVRTAHRQLARAWAWPGQRGLEARQRVQLRVFAELDEIVAQVIEGADHRRRLESAVAQADDVASDTTITLPYRLTVTRNPDGSLASGEPQGSLAERLRRQRAIYPQDAAARVFGAGLEDAVSEHLARVVVARLRAVTDLDELVTLAAVGVAEHVADPADDGTDFEERATQRREAAVRNEEFSRQALESRVHSLTAATADATLQARRRAIAPRRVTVGAWLDAPTICDLPVARMATADLLLVRTRIDLWLRRGVFELEVAIAEALDRSRQRLEVGLLGDVHHLRGALKHLAVGEGSAPLVRQRLEPDTEGLLREVTVAVDAMVGMLPEHVQVVSSGDLAAEVIDDASVHDVALARLISFVLETTLLTRVRGAVHELERVLGRAEEVVGDLVRSTRRLAEQQGDGLEDDAELAPEALQRLARTEAELREALGVLDAAVQDGLAALRGEIIGGSLFADQDAISRFVRARERARFLSRASALTERATQVTTRAAVDFALRWDAGLSAVHLDGPAEPDLPLVERLLAFRATVAPSAAILAMVPPFYRRAFLARGSSDGEALVGREPLIEAARRMVAAYDAGHHGALVVTGAPGAGTSAVLDRLLADILAGRRHVEIAPPPAARWAAAELDAAISVAVGSGAGADASLQLLPRGSCVVLRNLELWWCRQPGGTAALRRLASLVDAHGHRVLFVLECAGPSWRMLDRLGLLTDRTTGQLDCGPLETVHLLEAVLRRHRSTGLELRIDGASRPPRELALARFVVALRQHSGGTLGTALAAWLAHIEQVDARTVWLRVPEQVDPSILDELPSTWMTVLVALALHRRLDDDGLRAVCNEADEVIAILQRAGLVTRHQGVVELDRFTGPHLIHWFTKRGNL